MITSYMLILQDKISAYRDINCLLKTSVQCSHKGGATLPNNYEHAIAFVVQILKLLVN